MDYRKLSRVTDSKNRVSDAKSADEILKELGIIKENGALDKKKLISVLQASGAIGSVDAKKKEYDIKPDGEQNFVISDVSPEEAKELDKKTQHAAYMAWVLSRSDEDIEDFSYWDEDDHRIPMSREKWDSLSLEEKLDYQDEDDGPFNYSSYDKDTKKYHVFITWVR